MSGTCAHYNARNESIVINMRNALATIPPLVGISELCSFGASDYSLLSTDLF